MKVGEAVEKLREMDPDATLLTPRDGFSLEIEMIEPVVSPSMTFCEVAPGHWQRCLVEEDTCNRKTMKGVLLI